MTRPNRAKTDSPDDIDVGLPGDTHDAGVATMQAPLPADSPAEAEQPQTEQAEQTETEQGLTVRDVIQAETWYSIEEIAERLTIPVGVIREAYNSNQFGQFLHSGASTELYGGDVRHWILAEHIDYQVSDSAAEVWKRMHHSQPEPAAPAPLDLIGRAAAIGEAAKEQERAEQEQAEREAWGCYLAILARHDSPRSGDDRELAQIMADLSIDAEQIKHDLQVIERAHELEQLHLERETAAAQAVAARVATRALVERHKRELTAAWREQQRMEGHGRDCHNAADGLRELSRRRPALFSLTDDPPRLRGIG